MIGSILDHLKAPGRFGNACLAAVQDPRHDPKPNLCKYSQTISPRLSYANVPDETVPLSIGEETTSVGSISLARTDHVVRLDRRILWLGLVVVVGTYFALLAALVSQQNDNAVLQRENERKMGIIQGCETATIVHFRPVDNPRQARIGFVRQDDAVVAWDGVETQSRAVRVLVKWDSGLVESNLIVTDEVQKSANKKVTYFLGTYLGSDAGTLFEVKCTSGKNWCNVGVE